MVFDVYQEKEPPRTAIIEECKNTINKKIANTQEIRIQFGEDWFRGN